MVHYNRNINLIFFLVFPVISFLLGWQLSLQNINQREVEKETELNETIQTNESSHFENFLYKQKKEKEVDLSVFWEAWNHMEANFLHHENFKTKEQVYGAAKGLVASLEDPYTVFMDPEEYEKFEEAMSGEFQGIGAEIGYKDGNIVIISPIKGAPAEKAGLRAGDRVFLIDGESTQGMSIQEAVTLIRGPKGEKVELTVLREGAKEPLEIVIVRDNIILDSVEWSIEDGIATIEISQFGNDVLKEFRGAMMEIVLQKPNGIIIDLRNNGGGLLDACVEITSEFLDKKLIVQTRGRKFGDTAEITAGSGGAFVETPLIVLINKGSASASEIFSGAIQDHKRGLLIGETSFGKGTVQNVIPMSDGSSLKVTIAEWLTPDGNSINEEGIDPDIEIEMTAEHYENEEDPVMDKARELMQSPEKIDTLIEEKATERSQEKTPAKDE